MKRAYELMVILSGDLDDNAAQLQVKAITASINAVGASIHGNPDWWGKRRFAYPINKKEDGYYVVYNLEALGGALDEVERTLRIADEVVRHKLMRLPDHEAARRGMMSASA
jgi:small subunit ribosomal protein S6